MDFDDLDEARALYGALMEVFVAHTGGRDNPEALLRVEKLCEAAANAVEDVECRVAVRGVRSYSKLLFSADGHQGIDSGSLTGVDYLRLRINNCLSSFRGRLNVIEAERMQKQRIEFERRRRRQAEPPALSGAFRAEHPVTPGVRVLVVEDNPDSAESLRQLLNLSGYEVSLAYSGEEGVEMAKRIRPHVVLLDIGLPKANGFAVASALRDDPDTCAARLIAVTAYGADEDRRRAREAGFDLHLVKPVDPQVLLAKLYN